MEWDATICGFCPQELHCGYMDLTPEASVFYREIAVAFSEPREHSHSSVRFPVCKHFHPAPSLQDCHQCSCLCLRWRRPCPSCPWRTAARWVKSWSLLRASPVFHMPVLVGQTPGWALGLAASKGPEHHCLQCVMIICFWLVFLFQQMRRSKTSMAVRRTDAQMVSDTRAVSVCVELVSPASKR